MADAKSRKKAKKALLRLVQDAAVAEPVEAALHESDGSSVDAYKEMVKTVYMWLADASAGVGRIAQLKAGDVTAAQLRALATGS